MMETSGMHFIRAAFATDDGKTFIDRHFGDAGCFEIVDISDSAMIRIKQLNNRSAEDESSHADIKKAGSITDLLKSEGVQVAVAKVFGPNIMRIKKHFVCVRMNDPVIEEAVVRLQTHIGEIQGEWEKGEQRGFLNLLHAKDDIHHDQIDI
jgi:predicted Fe-Mo cluster-binding NifX family protein